MRASTDQVVRRRTARIVLFLVATTIVGGSLLPAGMLHAATATKPKYVQKKYLQITTGTTVSIPFKKANRAGDLIVAYVVWDNDGAVTLSDSQGNTYASAVGPTQSGGDPTHAQIFYAGNVSAGVNTVTATFASAITTHATLYIHEYSGIDRLAPLDTAIAASGTSLAMSTGTIAVTRANTLLFAGGASNGRSIRRGGKYHVRAKKYGNLAADKLATTPGSCDATGTQKGTSWSLQLVSFKPAGATPPPSSGAYPLKIGPNGRYLVDQNDVPFLIVGDSPQGLIANLSTAEADAFFANREAAGFNLVWINLLCGTYTGGRPDGSTYDGIVPFTTDGDLATPNEAYFARVDAMLNLAAEHGLTVLLDPAEAGSFLSVLLANGAAKSRDYGRFLGTRYRDFDNIIWMSGNDFQSWMTPSDDAVVQAVARGIHDTDGRHIHTVELDYLVSGSLDDASWAPLIDLNASYTYYPTYAQVLADYNRPNALPTFMVEANYEFEHNAADQGTAAILRRQEYWTMLSGAAGQLYGNRYTWPFIDGWEANLDTPGSVQFGYMKYLFAGRPWYNLIPDQTHTVVTAGNGTFADDGALGDNDYLTAARTPDGALVMAYMPTRRTITVDMSMLGSSAQASWYDPSNGTFTAIAGSPFANSGNRNFTPPGDNADGDGDWVLILEATSVPPDDDAPSVPNGLAAADVTSSQITVSWNPSHDNVAVAGYRLYRDGALITTTAATSATDTGLSASTAYAYRVAAFDYFNNVSSQSAPLVITTAAPGPNFLQQGYATPQSPQSSVSATYPEAETAGNTNIVAIGWNDTAASITSVTDSIGSVYVVAVPTFRGNGLSQAIYYAAGIDGVTGNVVTVTFDQPAAYVDLRVTEYSGLRLVNAFDAGVSATGTGTSAATGALTTSTPSELLFAAGMTSAVFTAPGAGFTSRVITAPDGDIVEDAVAATAGSHSATASLGSGSWLLQLAAFKAGP